MKKRLKKSIAFLLSITMIMTMLLNGTFVMTASAQGESSTTGVTFKVISGNPAGLSNEGYANLLDNNTSTKWCCNYSGSANVVIMASERIRVSGYIITTGNDTASNSGRNPKTWTLSASNDNETWAEIDTIEDGKLPAEDAKAVPFTITETTEYYQYFKFDITQLEGGDIMQISEFAITYTTCEHQWGSTDEKIDPTCTEGGYDVYECSICGSKKNVPNDIPVTGHEKGEDGKCTNCGTYMISNADELKTFTEAVKGGEWSANAVLTANITVNENVLKDDGTLADDVSGFTVWTPIGSYKYTGAFDGQNHTISGLYASDADTSFLGLFGYVEGGSISNVRVVDSYFSGNQHIGGICGSNNGGTFTNCHNASTVIGSYTGGICGTNKGTITNCTNAGVVGAENNSVGGICGYNQDATVTNSYNEGTVNGKGWVGGVCGYSNAIITDCYNEGAVSGTGSSVGGVCGNNRGSITNCYNTGVVSGTSSSIGGVCGYNLGGTTANCYNIGTVTGSESGTSVGGVCGRNDGTTKNSYNTGTVTASANNIGGVCGYNSSGTITNCYNTGTVTGSESSANIGGVCGYINGGTATNCYNTGSVTGGKSSTNIGGVCGYNSSGTITNCYYLAESETDSIDGTAFKNAKQFASGEVAYLLNGKTSEGELAWGQTIGTDDYPVFNNGTNMVCATTGCVSYNNAGNEGENPHTFDENGQCTVCGAYEPATDTDDDGCYEIGNAGQLYSFAQKVNGGETAICAILTADIVVNEGGVLDDNGDLKDGDFAAWPMIGYNIEYIGTFDGAGHNVSGVYLDGGYVQGVGLFGRVGSGGKVCNLGVTDSYFKGNSYWNGAVCGYNNEGTIENCYSDATVVGSNDGGGVCGQNQGTVANCYSVGKVSGNSNVGGVCGYNYGEITNCYYDSIVYSGDAIGTNNGTAVELSGKSTAKFASGEVCYLLNGKTSEGELVWGQTIGTDDYPVFNDGSNTVYVTTGCVSYNNDGDEGEKAHTCDENGKCTACGLYIISTAEQLFSFAEAARYDNTDICAVLAADITVNENVLNENGELNEGSFNAWTPIGSATSPYTGTFDGAGHTVSGLYLSDTEAKYVGLVGYLGINGTVCNVGVVDSYFSGNMGVGGVCGWNSGGVVTNCYADVTVNGSQSIGGVCGYNRGIITNCYSTSKVIGTTNYGGVCGFVINGTIINCYYDKLEFTGNAVGYQTEDYTVTNVYGITPAQFESGMVAYNLSQGCKIGSVTYDGSIWGQEIGKDKSPVLGGKKVYVTTGCVSYNNNGEEGEKEHNIVDGQCTVCGTYVISTPEQLFSFAAAVNEGNNEINAILTEDITVNNGVLDADGNLNSGEFDTWTPIGNETYSYNGTFDGAGHTISGLYFNDSNTSNVGLFGYVGENGVVSNVGVVDSYFSGAINIGGLCGYNGGQIGLCYFTGAVNGTDYVGGLCGYNESEITNCYYDSAVFGGGAIGYDDGTAQNVLGKTTAQFKSGEVCYLLNGDQSNLYWGQTIGTDDYPVFDGAKVYVTTGCVTYTNNAELNGTVKEHPEFVNGICPDCGEYKAAEEINGVYQIGTVTDLYWFAQAVNRGNNTINAVLTADITVNQNVLNENGELSEGSFKDWTPIGDYNGTFDGAGHTVSGLYFNNTSANEVGLFGCVGENGVVSNVGIVDSYLSGNYCVGGVCGNNYGQIGLCYFTGTVSGDTEVGGVCGDNYGLILSCYSAGVLSGEDYVGGVCGENYDTLAYCYYDSTVFGGSAIGYDDGSVDKVLSKTTAQFASGEVAYMLNFNPSNLYWGQTIGTDKYPTAHNDNNTVYVTTGCVTYTNDESLNGTVKEHGEFVNGICPVCGEYEAAKEIDGIYQISKASDLYWFADQVNSGNNEIDAVLTADITVNENVLKSDGTLNGSGFMAWTPIGDYDNNEYNGTFDGAGHTISGLYFNNTSACDVGFIGCVGGNGIVTNVGIVDSYINADEYVGAICGDNFGKVINCYFTGTVSGSCDIGGVCGYNEGIIANFYNSGMVNGDTEVGGVCGYNQGDIINCYFDSTVYGGSAIGEDYHNSVNVLGKTTAQFKSGEVAYLLSQGCTIGEGESAVTYDGAIWGQNIDNGKPTELYPALSGEKVYKITYKNGDSEYEADYANAGEFELPVSSLKGFVAYSDNTDYLFAGQKVQIESDTSFNIVTLTINMMNGASMRMNEKTGIRFYSQIDTDLITALRSAAENAGATISLGTMISKKSIIGEQDFTKDMSGQLADVKYKAKTWYSEDEFTGMVGSIVSIKESNYNEEFVGRGYVTVTCGDVSTTVYADYDGGSISNNSRSICYIANQIMLDQTEYEALSAEKKQLVKDFADKYTGEDKYNQ